MQNLSTSSAETGRRTAMEFETVHCPKRREHSIGPHILFSLQDLVRERRRREQKTSANFVKGVKCNHGSKVTECQPGSAQRLYSLIRAYLLLLFLVNFQLSNLFTYITLLKYAVLFLTLPLCYVFFATLLFGSH